MTIHHLHIPDEALSALCRKWQIHRLAIFGSALGEEFSAESDIDFLVDFKEHAEISLFDHLKIVEELQTLIGREVDLITRHSVENSFNWIRRNSILNTARTVYAAG